MKDENGNQILGLLRQIVSLEFIIHTLRQENRDLRERLENATDCRREPATERWQVDEYEDEE